MKKNQLVISTFFAITLSIFLSNTSVAEPANLALLKQEITVYHDSGDYQKELTKIIRKARNYTIERAKQNAQLAQPKKLAVVLDIDETSLSNYSHLVSHEFTTTHAQWRKYVRVANAPAIKPMLAFYKDAIKHNVAIFFVTGRKESERTATVRNLKQAGFHDWAALYLKPEDYNKPSVIPFKSQTRAVISKLGYTIIASIGDQESDLKGGYAEKTFKLPNPYYYIG